MDDAPALRDEDADDQERSERWQRMLTGSDPSLPRLRRVWRLVPDGPRCKMCAAPFHGVGRVVTKVISHGQSEKNPLMCNLCFASLRDHIGGADIELSVLFADVRGSTGLAERLGPATFRRRFEIVAQGSSKRCVLNPVNETERMRNRRVEIFTASGARPTPKPPTPFCGGMPGAAPPVELRALRVLAQTVLEGIPRPLRLGIKAPTTLRFLYRAEHTEAEKVFRAASTTAASCCPTASAWRVVLSRSR